MQNIYDVEKKIKQKPLNLPNLKNQEMLNDLDNLKQKINLAELGNLTSSTHKNSDDYYNSNKEKEIPFSTRITALELNMQKDIGETYTERPKKRKDYFGREIKKGGKHKICFADDLDIIKSLTPEVNIVNNNKNSNTLNNNRKSLHLCERKYSLPEIILKERSNSSNNVKSCLIKNIYNITKIKTQLNKKFKESIVDVINIENLKQETKLNTFFVNKNKTAIPEEENVTCSCYCLIW